jgi:hypothetical protein
MPIVDLLPVAGGFEPTRTHDADDNRFYEYPDGSGLQLPSVSTIIEGTNDKGFLRSWYARLSTAYCVDHLEELLWLRRTQGRDAAIAQASGAAETARLLKADVGSHVHAVQERLILWAFSYGSTGRDLELPEIPEHLVHAYYDLGGDLVLPVPDVVEAMQDGFLNFMSDFNPTLLAAEMPVYNTRHGYAGTLDDIFELDGYALDPAGDRLVGRRGSVLTACGDTKTGKDLKGTVREQLAAYRRASECLPSPAFGLHPMPPTDIGVVLHLRPDYPDGYMLMLVAGPADEAAWERFLKAGEIWTERHDVKDKPGKVIRPLRADGTMPGPRLCDLFGEYHGGAFGPLRRALGERTELAELAHFTRDELLGVKGVGPKRADEIEAAMTDYGYQLADAGKAA